jgi:formamidopyrimidine-DNA glycosylase
VPVPELPEIVVFARDMRKELVCRTIRGIEVLQPKCLNVPVEDFQAALTGTEIRDVTPRGKWLQVETTRGWLLVSLGMGGEILLTDREHLPEKHRLVFDLDDGTCLAINFWWFGYAHYVPDLAAHEMTVRLGPNALDLTLAEFRALLRGRRGAIKPFLLNQKRIAGIGNHGGSAWELNLYGEKGGWDERFLQVGYREGKPCPRCGTAVEKIKTGSTSGYVCPACQLLKDSEQNLAVATS